MSDLAEPSGMAFWGDSDDVGSRDRYRTFVEAIDDGICQLDVEGRFVAVNDVVVERTGYAAEELLGAHVSVLFEEADSAALERTIERLRTAPGGENESLDVTVETASSASLHWELRVNPVVEGGDVQGVVGIARDVTDRNLRERDRRHVIRALNAAREGISLLDDEGEFIYVNDAYADTFGYAPEEMIGEHWEDLGIESDPGHFHEDILPRLAERGQWTGTTTCLRSDDSPFLAHHTLTHTEDDDLICVVRDVTERRERERELERYERIVENLPVGVYRNTPGPDGELVTANDMLASIFDADSVEELTEYDVSDLYVDPEERVAFSETLERQGMVDSYELKQQTLDGETIWISVTAIKIEEGGEVFFDGIVQDVTERKAHERELEKYETIVETVEDGIYVKDEDGRFTMVNEAYADLTGYDREELIGEHASLVVDEDLVQESREAWTSAADADPSDSRIEATIRTADGDTIPAEGVFSTLRTDEGDSREVGVVRDVTERKERERDLERALDLLDRTERIADVGGWEIDVDTMDVFWTEHIFELLEVEGDEEPPLDEALDMYHEADRQVVEDAFEAALEEGEPFDVEVRNRTDSGAVIWIRLQGVPETVDGEVVSLRGAAQDVTDRKERERELRQQRERLTALINLHQVALEVNQALARQSSREEIEAVVCDRLVDAESYEFAWVGTVDGETVVPSTLGDDQDFFAEVVDATGDGIADDGPAARAVDSGELQVVRDVAGTRASADWSAEDPDSTVLACAAVPVAYEERQYGVLNIYTSRTDAFDEEETEVVRQLGEIMGLGIAAAERERELEHERERFELLNRLIRHNLLNTLNVVEARLGLLEGHVDYEVAEHLETAQNRTAEMSRLVETIRGLMRAIGNESHELETIDLGTVLENQVEQAQQTFDHATFEVEGGLTDAEPVMADDLLGVVLENVLTNAVQHNDKEPPQIRVAVESDATATTVRVADNGPGVPEELKDRIFQKGEMGFDSPGTGFGLYLVREIVNAYDGTIDIEDNDPEGSVFAITLPRAGTEGGESP